MSSVVSKKVPKSSNAKKSKSVGPPVALNAKVKSSPPKINGSDRIVIKRREFVGSVSNGATTGFALTPASLTTPGYDINPSISTMFPWLSNIAVCYERYRFTSLVFTFVPSQPTTTAGRFYAAVDYDYDDAIATSKAQLMGNLSAVEVPVWQECKLACDPAALNRELPYRYVNSTSRTAFVESRTTFAGFLMCAYDTSVANCIMDLWCEYSIELVTPVYDSPASQTWGGPVTATTAVVSACGTSWLGFPAPYWLSMPPGPIKLVDSSVPTFPVINVSHGGTTKVAPRALDVSGALGRGWLETLINVIADGTAPSSLLSAAVTMVSDWYAYDANALFMGSVAASPTVFTPSVSSNCEGCEPGKSLVNGSTVSQKASINLDLLYRTFPTIRYLVPLITSVANITNGSTGFGFEYHF